MTKPVFILRWIAVLPGALIAAFLARAFVGVLSFLGDMNPLTWIFTGSSHYGNCSAVYNGQPQAVQY